MSLTLSQSFIAELQTFQGILGHFIGLRKLTIRQ